MHDSEKSLQRGERILSRIINCDVDKQRRITVIFAVVAFLIAVGFTIAGIVLEDVLFLTIGFVEVLAGAILCAGRFHILRLYEQIQELNEQFPLLSRGANCDR